MVSCTSQHCDINVYDEEARLATLASYCILDTPPDTAFDEITELASLICDTPIAVINFVGRNRQWFKSEKGLGVKETPLNISICAHVLLQSELFIIPDTSQDPRFVHNPLVTGKPFVRFYAGTPLKSPGGLPLGTLCVLDHRPRELTEIQRVALSTLANQVMRNLELIRVQQAQSGLIQQLQSAQQELTHLAATDPLTGLYNRRAFEERLSQEHALIQRGQSPAALMMMDLDYFKVINDDFGHKAGDRVIEHFAQVCRNVFRQSDLIGRWGGEEFVVLLPDTTESEAWQAAERLHQVLRQTRIEYDEQISLSITVSIGLFSLSKDRELEEAMRLADTLLYQAKDNGRNCTVCADFRETY
ncbi:sensor domain-containing diguanylate cyclase [uncultured Oceanisphaera sp.]|uniref:sensor domain-containing diguanylate cyclase n=1 Tax=uncultured Oceanisphaera sp. TaxID=353858 RepID=UPI00260D847E|nr:sensor domain-containing diguanylate cyclase [uncultured Oceanisphaera sp.]